MNNIGIMNEVAANGQSNKQQKENGNAPTDDKTGPVADEFPKVFTPEG
jgi:hypothetical protein